MSELTGPDEPISPYDFLIPYTASEDDDDDDFSLTDDSKYIDCGWSGKCLQDVEDIDFEFVYALHTFVATVEGQANATKGDTMVLLDDSNSYWWLVRVVKDSSIGYLPAEHIETPTERLARLNKHRNIDLSQSMLGDTAGEKSKSTLKVALRGKRKKTVVFTAPTYVEASDVDYSSEEEEEFDGEPGQQQAAQQQQQQQQQQAQQATTVDNVEDDSAKVEPLKPRVRSNSEEKEEIDEDEAESRDSDEIFEGKSDNRARTTRNGTVRNTDSFFKDETVETKKITLTPNLLRDDDSRDSNSLDSQGLRQRPSFDRLEKELVTDKQKKKEKDKKEKDKKPSVIRSFFSRKDKKKSVDDDDDSFGKRSLDASLDGAEEDAKSVEVDGSPEKVASPQRNPSKLQKSQPRAESSPSRKNSNARDTQAAAVEATQALAAAGKAKEGSNGTSASLRMVESDPIDAADRSPPKESKISKILHPPPRVSKSKSRVELDDFDSSEDGEIIAALEPSREAPLSPEASQRQTPEEKQTRPVLPGSYPDSYLGTAQPPTPQPTAPNARLQQPLERLSESPVQVSPITSSNPPALMGDTSSQEDRSSPISSPSPEPADVRGHQNQDSMTSTSATGAATWNDNNLRAFFDSSSEIRDLLTVVYDKTDVPPAGPDHPVVGTLFKEQNAKLAEITSQLDNMLGDWLARKQRLRGTV
ncbi:hypothetical protein BKA67DRAFT_207582 [Truncatella angustata]|uniref:SH3 domain-containing protein n=1 Tax=Truncatella angustata TaxID=152316 RepID=A0A9P8UTP8_9PEZI|nr:uncharacterized protein BKA67DRAFT_207582 [Truncatella angustata]KAH6658168.1 hypothetical protein BKA67DRAFT_207582 [Truncatella angustata]